MALPARPAGIRTSPDMLTVAVLFLDPAEVEDWTDWNPAEHDDGDG